MSVLAPREVIIFPSLLNLTVTSTRASVPPLIASTWYSSSRILAVSATDFASTCMAASTGPSPVAAPVISFPRTSRVTEAVGIMLFPETTVNWRSRITGLHSIAMTASATAMRSESLTLLPESPRSLILDTIALSCCSFGVYFISWSAASTEAEPECLPSTILRFLPICSGRMDSYVAGSRSTPWAWIPLSWVNAISPTTALLTGKGMPVRRETRVERE